MHRRDVNRVWQFLKMVFRGVNRETVEFQRPRHNRKRNFHKLDAAIFLSRKLETAGDLLGPQKLKATRQAGVTGNTPRRRACLARLRAPCFFDCHANGDRENATPCFVRTRRCALSAASR
jgi:hypothetical protein